MLMRRIISYHFWNQQNQEGSGFMISPPKGRGNYNHDHNLLNPWVDRDESGIGNGRSALLNWRVGWPNVDIFIRRDIGDSFNRSKPLHIIVFTGASDHSDLTQHFINRETRPG